MPKITIKMLEWDLNKAKSQLETERKLQGIRYKMHPDSCHLPTNSIIKKLTRKRNKLKRTVRKEKKLHIDLTDM